MTQERNTLPRQDAFALVRAATNISQARKSKDTGALVLALDQNLQLWTAIQTLISYKENPLSQTAKENLIKLTHYVVAKTIKFGAEASQEILDTFENINLQIAEGLLENAPELS